MEKASDCAVSVKGRLCLLVVSVPLDLQHPLVLLVRPRRRLSVHIDVLLTFAHPEILASLLLSRVLRLYLF